MFEMLSFVFLCGLLTFCASIIMLLIAGDNNLLVSKMRAPMVASTVSVFKFSVSNLFIDQVTDGTVASLLKPQVPRWAQTGQRWSLWR